MDRATAAPILRDDSYSRAAAMLNSAPDTGRLVTDFVTHRAVLPYEHALMSDFWTAIGSVPFGLLPMFRVYALIVQESCDDQARSCYLRL
jgi:hypothetical protein